MKTKIRNAIGVALMIIGVGCLLWQPLYRAATKRTPTFATTFSFTNWSDTKATALVDLHENDLVTYEISHMDGWIDVWIENLRGEQITKPATSGTTELLITERGDYLLWIEGEHAGASVKLCIYTDDEIPYRWE